MNINERLSVPVSELTSLAKGKGQSAGSVKWSNGASISFTYNADKSLLVLKYTYQQTESIEEPINVVRMATNLHKGLQCFALCPITGKKCRKLYLYGGLFVSRHAIPENYASSNQSKRQRNLEKQFSFILLADKSKYRKEYYNGNITPFGKKCEKAVEGFLSAYSEFQSATPFNNLKKHNNSYV